MPEIVLIAHNIRSTHNVGALFRTAEGFGVTKMILSGYTPFPSIVDDPRLPHIAEKITRDIHKTALGAELMVPFEHVPELSLASFKADGYHVVGLELAEASIPLPEFHPPAKFALLLGEEVAGISTEHLALCDSIVEIPMTGQKESFNVSVAAGIALYGLTYPRA
jgi:23S rRNA (guanosine2251-2'-O)-methyltransferase